MYDIFSCSFLFRVSSEYIHTFFVVHFFCATPQVLQGEEQGVVVEFVNPKYKAGSRTDFKKPTRLECMMQDFPKLMSKELGDSTKVGRHGAGKRAHRPSRWQRQKYLPISPLFLFTLDSSTGSNIFSLSVPFFCIRAQDFKAHIERILSRFG